MAMEVGTGRKNRAIGRCALGVVIVFVVTVVVIVFFVVVVVLT